MTQAFSQTPALPINHPLITEDSERSTAESALIKGYRGQQGHRRPVWFMRQAGRSLPEYRKLREGTTMLESCLIPEMASEITLQPVRRHDVDAAIFFSDIVIPLKLAGIGLERSEEHTSELQSRGHIVCRLLLGKKKNIHE